jgi:energy-coupling factor transporter ATP-binding protein EcfA2
MIGASVEVEGLHYRYEDGTDALRGIDFTLNAGQSIALLGANGSGKTTFALHLNGLLRATAGNIRIGGVELNDASLTAIRRQVGVVFQDSDNQLFMPTVLEDVAFGPLAAGETPQAAQARAVEALERTGLNGKGGKAPWHLSAGEKKRAAIAGVLACDARLLVLDEPTTFLDPPGQRSLAELLLRLPQTKILITHDVRFAASLAPEAAYFEDGKIVMRGPTARVIEQYRW